MPTPAIRRARRRLTRSLVALVVVVLVVGYVVNVNNVRDQVTRTRIGCLRAADSRWSDVLDQHVTAHRERLLAELTHGLEAAAHQASADRADQSALERLRATSPTKQGRVAFCARAYPLPSLLP